MKLSFGTFGPVVILAACAGHHEPDLPPDPVDAGVDAAPHDAGIDRMNDMNPCWSCSPPDWCDFMPGWEPPDLSGLDCGGDR